MSEKKSLIPTLTCAAGMLLGGLAGSTLGLMGKGESVVMAGYVVGCLLGSVLGSIVGIRWVRGKDRQSRKGEPSKTDVH